MILRAISVLIVFIYLFVGVSYLNRNYENDYDIRAWSHYESQLLSSGAPPESDIDIKNEKFDEVRRHIDNRNYVFRIYLCFGTEGISINYIN